MDNNNTLKLISQKPLKQLILEQGEELKQVVNPKTGKSFLFAVQYEDTYPRLP